MVNYYPKHYKTYKKIVAGETSMVHWKGPVYGLRWLGDQHKMFFFNIKRG